ncbi:MAG: hypothetical protein WKG07_00110 [Hymenobacter sp.]
MLTACGLPLDGGRQRRPAAEPPTPSPSTRGRGVTTGISAADRSHTVRIAGPR